MYFYNIKSTKKFILKKFKFDLKNREQKTGAN